MRAALSEGRSSVRDMSTESRPGVVRVAGLGLSWVGVEASTMRGAEAVAVMRGCFHRRNRGTADLLRAMHVAGRATAGTGARRALLDDFSGDEVAGALGWSRSMASRWLDLADDLVSRLCEVLTAMDGGALDDAKARVVSEWTRDLSDDHAHALCADVLPWAPGLSVGALIERIQEVAVAIDPDWAARREARARTRARVVGGTNPSGTANLSGYDLPVDEAVEALARVEAIAAEVRRRGVRIPVARLRATVYLRLLDGFCAGLDDDALVTALVAMLREPDEDGPGAGPPDRGPDGPDGPSDDEGTPDEEPEGPSDDPHGSADDTDEAGDGDDAAADDPGPHGDGPGEPGGAGEPVGDARSEPHGASPDGADADGSPDLVDDAPPTRGLRQGTVEVRLRLSTALGLDDLPARIPGWGVILAHTAGSILCARRDAEWRIVVTDDQGRLLHVLLTRRRPRGPCRARRGQRTGRGIVELQVPATLLAALVPSCHPDWAGLIAEAQDRLATLPPDGTSPDRFATAPDAAARRRLRAELDRWVRVRDRFCVGLGCRRPAATCDLDHTRGWAFGGPSAAWNLGALCRHSHRAKHEGGWRLVQPEPGSFLWSSRAGVTYMAEARRVTEPLPAPLPCPRGPRPLDDDAWPSCADGWLGPPDLLPAIPAVPAVPATGPPPPRRDPDDDPPPF